MTNHKLADGPVNVQRDINDSAGATHLPMSGGHPSPGLMMIPDAAWKDTREALDPSLVNANAGISRYQARPSGIVFTPSRCPGGKNGASTFAHVCGSGDHLAEKDSPGRWGLRPLREGALREPTAGSRTWKRKVRGCEGWIVPGDVSTGPLQRAAPRFLGSMSFGLQDIE